MSQNKQEKKQMQKKIQSLYRETKQQNKEIMDYNLSTFWKFIVSICVITFCVFLVMGALFDLGFDVPEIFGR